ncbi:hypothetical protein B0J13DRAFT_566882 [Dactylonectria estremocensis]|uniref:Uncharacterized protein n=1 Tax=Dactylonectria estremocensis TaxID=1079267 RepID=A0A9P9DM47_9HYPO|nr:hypothetical protein B0J13DRAFT_566882 [Dactylonectria estremocensis]
MRSPSLSSVLLLAALSMDTMAEKLLYRNTFNSPDAIAGWVAEGPIKATVSNNTLELSSSGGINDHFVYWVPEVFPDRIRITWEFTPIQEPGLAMFFFGAKAVDGGSIFDKDLAPRNGSYAQYHSGDIQTLHASYFRRRWPEERAFHLANLRKSPGFHLVSQGADALPSVEDTKGAFYTVEVIKDKRDVQFSVNGLLLWSWEDVDRSTGPVVRDGRIGLRQMNPLIAQYRNLEVWKL